jgi:zinc/manganese transport system substrate-binding protein
MPRTSLLALPATLIALLAAGCGTDETKTASGDRMTVVATTGFAADLVRAVAGGDVEVVQLVPDSANPHSYAASARDRATLDTADLVVAFGRSYEEGLPLDELRSPRFAIADHTGELRRFEEGETAEVGHADGLGGEEHRDEDGHEHEDEDEEEHGEAGAPDPHVWMDPTRLAAAAPALADALGRADGENTAAHRERAAKHAAELHRLDRELREILRTVPPERRRLVTSHESMGYFAARYDFAFVGAPLGIAPEAQASAERIAKVVEDVREAGVPAVFAQQGDDPKVMRQVAREAGVEVVGDLLVESPGPRGDSYSAAMLHNARRIAGALGR